MEKEKHSLIGLSFTQILALIFIVLKLTDYITWSWLWVLSPLWIPVAFILGLFVVAFVVVFVVGFIVALFGKLTAIRLL